MRRYRDLDMDFAPGLTVVRGPNEAGKTTIQRALELALTRKVTSTNGDLESHRPWDAQPETRPVIRLEFTTEDDEGTRKGVLENAFRGPKGTVRLARDEAALRDRLQASISGADRGTSAARKKLERAIHDLTKGGDKFPGRLKEAGQTVAELEASVAAGEEGLAQLEEDRDALAEARDRRARDEADLAERRPMLEKARQAERLHAERDAARERFERYKTAVE